MQHIHSVVDTDTRFIINPITRQIRNETSRKTSLMQNDHNSERFTFELPRYIENHDMSHCNKVEVHYLNSSAKDKEAFNKGLYTVTDLKVSEDDPEKVVLSWLISNNATQLVGKLSFRIHFKCVENDVITYAWHTAIFTEISISDGINADESFEMEYVDIIAQWKYALKREVTEEVNANVSAWAEEESGRVRGEMTSFSAQWNDALSVERKRIDNIVAMPEGATTNDAELMDIRVGISGNPFAVAGSAVREQLGSLVKNIDEICTGENINVFWRYANDENKGKVYKNDTGELISTSGNYSHTGLISVKPGQTVTVYEPEPDGKCVTMMGAYFDADRNVVRGMGMHPNYTSGEPVEIVVPDGVFFIGINYHLSFRGDTAVIPHQNLPWAVSNGSQKVWCCIGDSLTEANSRAKKHYFDYVAEELGLSVLNYGVSGTGYKNGSFTSRISGIIEEFDIMTIFGSFNDLDSEWNLGEYTDSDTNTICGCINATIQAFFNKYPTKKLGIITPTPWKLGIEYFGKVTTIENMEAYVEALLSIAKRHRVPCLDLYHYSGLNPDNGMVLTKYFNENGVQDVGAHPNSDGHKFIFPVVREFVKTML